MRPRRRPGRGTLRGRPRSAVPAPAGKGRSRVGSRSSWRVPGRVATPRRSVREMTGVCARKDWSRELFQQLPEQPGPAEGPEPVGSATADPQGIGRLLVRQAGEITQVHESGRDRIMTLKPGQSLVQGNEIVRLAARRLEFLREIDTNAATAVLLGLLAARLIDQDATHGLRRGTEKMAAAVPLLRLLTADQPQIRLMNQGRGLKCLTGFLGGQFSGGQLPKLGVDEREQPVGGLCVTGRGRVQQLGYSGHAPKVNGCEAMPQVPARVVSISSWPRT